MLWICEAELGTAWKVSAVFSLIVKGLVVFFWRFHNEFHRWICWRNLCWVHRARRRECQCVSPRRIISRFCGMGAVCQTWLAVSGPSLLHYLSWSSARVNYRGTPEPCVTENGRHNIAILTCPVQERQEETEKKVHLLSLNPCSLFSTLQSF